MCRVFNFLGRVTVALRGNLRIVTDTHTRSTHHSMHNMTHVAARHHLKLVTSQTVISRTRQHSMSKAPARNELIEALESRGESPPSSWTVVEMKSRLAELKSEAGESSSKTTRRTSLQEWTTKLNKSGTKKATLAAFCSQELGVPLSGNETKDPLGYGMHSSLTYEEAKQSQPEYCEWVMRTYKEGQAPGGGGTSYRLARFARWLERTEHMKEIVKTEAVNNDMSQHKTKKTSRTSASRSQSSTSTVVAQMAGMMQQQQQMMGTLMATVENLKEEVSGMKEEKPHKKAATPMDDF